MAFKRLTAQRKLPIMLTRLLVYGLGVLMLAGLATPGDAAEPAHSPSTFVTELARKALVSVNSKTLSSAERQRQLEGLVDADFDLPRISSFLLGPYWRTASETERHDFTAVLRAFVVSVYHQHFSAYSGGSFRVLGQIPDAAHGTIVHTEITEPASGQPVKVTWRVIQKEGYRIIDMSFAGISMARAKRDEFASYLRWNGGDLVDLILRLQAVMSAQQSR